MVRDVLIVGGGSAGLASAIALQRNGVKTTVIEKSPTWDVLGHGITIMSAMLRALDALGLAEECVRRGAGADGATVYDRDSRPIARIPIAKVAGDGFPGIAGLMRPQLHAMLLEAATAAGADVRLGLSVAALTETPDGVDVTLTDGTRTTTDLVIGADGLHSHVRDLILDPPVRPQPAGQAVWRAIVPLPDDYTEVMFVPGPRGKSGINAVSATHGYVFASINTSAMDRAPREQWPELFRGLLTEFGGPVGAVAHHVTDPAAIDHRALQAVIVPAPWHRGRVVLIGDAAHSPLPHLAMGAGLAVEDAIVLAELLQTSPSVPAALQGFTLRRFERCRMIVENSIQICAWEREPTPDADAEALMERSWTTLAAPF